MQISLLVVAAAAVGGPGLPQDKRTSGGQVPGSAIIVQHPAVQNDLKLSGAQRKAISELPQKVRKKFQPELEAIQKLQDAERRAKEKDIRTRFTAEYPRAVAEILNSDQQKRFRQLQLQHFGLDAFKEKDVIETLKLSTQQQEQIGQITLERVRTTRNEQIAQINVVFDDAQREFWKGLTGRPFEFEASPESAIVKADRLKIEPTLKAGSREWVDACIEAWKPTEEETRIRGVGWVGEIRGAVSLAKKHGRPVFLFNYSGRIEHNRC